MKHRLMLFVLFLSFYSFAQPDSIRKIEPAHETSFDNYGLLAIAVVGLLVLMGLRFWFRRTRKR